jgi:AcrR family transcriptional regulator
MSAQDRRLQILSVAMDLFARQGYEGTTTREISERAGVNEAIIFRHFPHKEDLYWAILDHNCRLSSRRRQLQTRLNASDNDREIFAAIANDILARNAEDPRVFRLLLFSGLEHHRLSERYYRTYLARNYKLLAERIRLRIRDGIFRAVDPLLAARSFLGMVVYHFLIEELFARKPCAKSRMKRVSETIANIWLRGMTVSRGEAKAGGTPASVPASAAGAAAAGLGHAARNPGAQARTGRSPRPVPANDIASGRAAVPAAKL